MATNMLTLADVTPSAADRIAVDQAPAMAENNLMKNRLMAMQVKDQGQSQAAQKAKENYLMGYDPNNPDSLPKPKNIGEYQAFQEIQATNAARLAPAVSQAETLIKGFYTDNDPIKLDQAKSIINSDPQIKKIFQQNGLWASVSQAKVDDMGNFEQPMFMSAEMIKKAAQKPNSPFSGNEMPGFFDLKYTSPRGADIFGDQTIFRKQSRSKLTKDQLADMQANGSKEAGIELASRIQNESEGGAAYKVGHMRERDEGRTKIYESFLGGDPNDLKNWKRLSAAEKDKPLVDGFSAYMNRPMQMFDTKTGRVVAVKAGIAAEQPERYVSPRDPDVVTLTLASKYEGTVSGFVKSIDSMGGLVKKIMDTTGLNKNPKIANYTIQELIKNRLLGSGDVAGLRNAMMGLRGELGKMAEGSMGVAAVSVETAKLYRESISDNMPIGEFVKMYRWAKEEGKSRQGGLRSNINDIRARLGAGPRKEASDGDSPSKATWMDAAKKANPKASNNELSSYYDKKYGAK